MMARNENWNIFADIDYMSIHRKSFGMQYEHIFVSYFSLLWISNIFEQDFLIF